MNIAILSYHRIGGSGIIAYEIGRALAEEKGYNIHFIGLEPPFRLTDQSENMRFHKVCVKEYPVFDYQPYTLSLASQLSEIIKRCNIDIIHSHYALPHAISALLAKDISGENVKCVTTLHGTDITIVGSHPGMANITKYAIEKSDAVTTVSNYLKKETEKKFNISKNKIQTIYNFINPTFFNSSFKKDIKKNENELIILHISNLRSVKSPADVIKIFSKLKNSIKGKSLKLHIIGEGPMKYEMMSYADELKISESVKFIGSRSKLGPAIANADMFILPSKQESFGLVALEAMACGVPVLASKVGGLLELIDDGKNGVLFEYGNIDEAVKKGTKILIDNKHKDTMIANAYNSVQNQFDMKNIINQYERLYIETLSQN